MQWLPVGWGPHPNACLSSLYPSPIPTQAFHNEVRWEKALFEGLVTSNRAWHRLVGYSSPALPPASPMCANWFSLEAALWASPAWPSGAFFTKVVDLGASSLKLEIWDTAGQEKYHSVCHLYFRGANAALLVYDITQEDSFHKAQQWLEDLEKEFSPGEVIVMLVGNKTDLGEEREEGKEFAESRSLLFMETSAKLNYQVSEVFGTVARELLKKAGDQGSRQGGEAVVLTQGPAARQGKCCIR
ncbi:ras-related protein Rab-17 isoform X2 [Nannospalax galili]|uniref:ras-related protein Rab-17 isoform X2 n=1 Tax=Nannospalax galili TaxID=1026970 RepID=UPI00111BD259|nr:ras-related protein Rab-17 isoform X2 [Nannospalax galili]